MTEPVTTTLQRFFARHAAARLHRARNVSRASRASDKQPHRPDFAETRPVVFRSEAFAEDMVLSHGAV